MRGHRTIRRPSAARQATWLPLPTVARRLRIPFGSALHLVRIGRLPAILVGGCRWFVRSDDLTTYRQQRRRATHGRAA
jgi:hypothetical protein